MNFKFSKKQIIIGAVALLVVLVVANNIISNNKKFSQMQTVKVERGSLEQVVSVTGKVKPAKSIAMAFDRGGRVQGISVKTGQEVRVGQLLITLENSELLAQKKQAKAALDAQLVRLDELKRGARTEDVQITQSQYQKASSDLDNAYLGAPSTLKAAFVASDTALNQTISPLFRTFNYSADVDYQLNYTYCNSNAGRQTDKNRKSLDTDLNDWEKEINAIAADKNTHEQLDSAIANSETRLKKLIGFLNVMSETLTVDCQLSTAEDAALDVARPLVSGAITSLNTQLTTVISLHNSIDAYKKTLDIAQSQLAYKKAPATQDQIGYQQALIDQAQASLDLIEAQLSKTYLFAPINGIISAIDTEVGENVNAGKSYISIMSNDPYQIEANISENDIAKITIGSRCILTFDALGANRKFEANVALIDPAETVIDGVSSYKTTFALNEPNNEIKSGMTANIDIVTAVKEGVLYIPNRSLIKGDKIQVKVMQNGKINLVEVKTGIKDTNGNIEIVSGLNEGDVIVSQ